MIKSGYSSGLLNESKQVGRLYHFTPVASLVKIIESNELRASQADNHTAKSISFTRDKQLSRGRASTARLVIDGDKLSNNLRIKPINIISSDPYSLPWETESEERVIGSITDLKKYLVSVDLHIRLLKDPKHADRTKKILSRVGIDSIDDLLAFLDKHKIPHGIYGKISDKG